MDEKNNTTTPETIPTQLESFGPVEEEYKGFKRSKVVILKVPYEMTTTYIQGTKYGPDAIINASKYMELFDEELNQETYKIGIHVMDLAGVGNLNSEAMVEKVRSSVLDLLKSNKFPVMLGGEHSVTVGAVKAFKEIYPNLSCLHLDAHYDMRNEYKGSKLNHGCVARRIQEICPLVQAGTRSLSKEEKDFLSSQEAQGRVKTLNVYDILEMPLWKDTITNSLSENVYVTIDLDVFDPSLVPSVGTPEPGGLGWYEALDLLREVSKDKRIVGFDVVELCPAKGMVASDFLAAKLIYRLLGYAFLRK